MNTHKLLHGVFLIAAVLIGIFVLFISLLSSSKTVEFGARPDSRQQKPLRMFFSKEILPGTLMYPFLMARDWATLKLADTDTQRMDLYLKYADVRLNNAYVLMGKNETELSITSASKGELYMGKAFELVKANPQNYNPQTFLEQLITHNILLSEIREATITDAQRSQLDAILQYNETLRTETQRLIQ